MKIINLPTFAEYCSSKSGCGLHYTTNFNRTGGIYREKIENAYYMHCHCLDGYSEHFLRNGMYTNIEDTTVEINRQMTKDMKTVQRKKQVLKL
jgi:hypothetical protein